MLAPVLPTATIVRSVPEDSSRDFILVMPPMRLARTFSAIRTADEGFPAHPDAGGGPTHVTFTRIGLCPFPLCGLDSNHQQAR